MSDAPTNGDLVAGGDDELMAELRALGGRIDPVPEDAIAAARSAIAWRSMDSELADLVEDSSTDQGMAGVRGTPTSLLLTFQAPGLTVEVQVMGGERGPRLLGQLVPPGPPHVEVRHPGGLVAVDADPVGRFSTGDLIAGPTSIRCSGAGSVVETAWFLT